MSSDESDDYSVAMKAADRILNIAKKNSNVLQEKGLQHRIQEITSLGKRKRQPLRHAKQPIRKQNFSIERFCSGLTDPQRKRFSSAAKAVQNANWEQGSPLFTGLTFQRASNADEFATLVNWCNMRTTDAVREVRILGVVLEAYMQDKAKVRGVTMDHMIRELVKRTGRTKSEIEGLGRCGRWHMDILAAKNVGLGALALLGDKHYSTGNHVPVEAATKFAECCAEVNGFTSKSYELATYVYAGFQLCIGKLCPREGLSRDSLLQSILDGHARLSDDELRARAFPSHPGPQFLITSCNQVPDTAVQIRLAMNGDICGLRRLFTQGLAHPNDVSASRGFGMLRWTLYGGTKNHKCAKFLIDQGAFVDEESYEHVWDFAYRQKCTPEELAGLTCVTSSPPPKYEIVDWVDQQKFPPIHYILVLGQIPKRLRDEFRAKPDAVDIPKRFREESGANPDAADVPEHLTDELRKNPKSAYVTDATGRTALDWATARAQLSDMRKLIAHSADVNNIDKNNRSTVLHAVDSHSSEGLRILLEAGANPNPEVSDRSSPLIAASFGCLPEMVKLLLNYGAKVDTSNPEGITALQAVARQNNDAATKCAEILLHHGADPSYISSDRSSPLHTAISHNSHKVLRLIIQKCHTSCCRDVHLLLPTIAEFADAETMSVLASSNLLRSIRPDRLSGDDCAANSRKLRSRADYNQILEKAFECLLLGLTPYATRITVTA